MKIVEAEVQALVGLEQSVLAELKRLDDEHVREPSNAAAASSSSSSPAAFEAASSALRARLRAHAERVERLEELAAVQERPADEEDVKRHARRHRSEGKALADGLRDLAAKVRANRTRLEAAERAALLQVEEEFGGSPSAGAGASSQLAARASTQAARKVTDSLRRTRELMSSELNRFDTTLRDLDEQGKSLKTTEDQHKGGIDGSLGAASADHAPPAARADRPRAHRPRVCLLCAHRAYIIKKRVGLNFSRSQSGPWRRAAAAEPAIGQQRRRQQQRRRRQRRRRRRRRRGGGARDRRGERAAAAAARRSGSVGGERAGR